MVRIDQPSSALARGAWLLLLAVAVVFLSASVGCQSSRPPAPVLPSASAQTDPDLVPAHPLPSVRAIVTPPAGWTAQPLKTGSRHVHQLWISPSGRTAFGVIHFTLPLPVSANFVLPFYIAAWKRDQGEATLLRKENDGSLPGVRFVAEGGLYKQWANLIVSGRQGWSVYAGALRSQPVSEEELDLAGRAREETRVGLPSAD